MFPSSCSIKGHAEASFMKSKDSLTPKSLWSVLKFVMTSRKKRIMISCSKDRGVSQKTWEPKEDTKAILPDIVDGCIEVNSIQLAAGKSASIYLGQCYKYTLPFGMSSSDTGHVTMILPLPYIMDGCYKISGNIKGVVGIGSGEEHYTACLDLEIYIKSLKDKEFEQFVGEGYKIFAFKLRYPDHFPKDPDSESDYATGPSGGETDKEDQEDDNEPEPPVKKVKKNGIRKLYLKGNRYVERIKAAKGGNIYTAGREDQEGPSAMNDQDVEEPNAL